MLSGRGRPLKLRRVWIKPNVTLVLDVKWCRNCHSCCRWFFKHGFRSGCSRLTSERAMVAAASGRTRRHKRLPDIRQSFERPCFCIPLNVNVALHVGGTGHNRRARGFTWGRFGQRGSTSPLMLAPVQALPAGAATRHRHLTARPPAHRRRLTTSGLLRRRRSTPAGSAGRAGGRARWFPGGLPNKARHPPQD